MLCGNRFRSLMVVFVVGLGAVHAAWSGSQASASLTVAQTDGRTCRDFEDTLSDEQVKKQYPGVKKKWYHMGKRCFCSFQMWPSEGCGKVQQVKDGQGDVWPSFRLGGADSSCRCLWRKMCDDFKDTLSDEQVKRKVGVKKWYQRFRRVKRCFCDLEHFPSKQCGIVEEVKYSYPRENISWTFRSFALSKAGPGCECLRGSGKAQERSNVVAAAAVRFCAQVVEKTTAKEELSEGRSNLKRWGYLYDLKLRPEICQEVLTGTLDQFGTAWNKEVFGEADGLSQHQGTRGWGHLDPLVTEALPSSTDYHIKLLKHVCHDECHEIVEETTMMINEMARDVESEATPFEQVCADTVVRKVEAEILGCCARSCEYNGKSCLAWPFFAKADKITWLEECCTEWNVLSDSPREAMCASVLTPGQATEVAASDIKVKEGIDMGEPYIGQGPLLRWTKKGVKSWLGKKYSQSRHPPRANGPVLSQVMEEHPDIRAEGIKKNWFKEKNITDMADMGPERGAASFVEASGEQCDVRDMTQCTATFQDLKLRSCLKQKKWKVSPKVQEKKKDEYEDGCPKGNPQPVETPEKCLTAFQNSSDVKSFFFEFHNEDDKPLNEESPARPIKCYVETKGAPCDAGFPKVKQSFQDIASEDLQLEQLTFWLAAEDL